MTPIEEKNPQKLAVAKAPFKNLRTFAVKMAHQSTLPHVPGGHRQGMNKPRPVGQKIAGHHLAAIKPMIDQMKPELAQQLNGWTSIMPNYSLMEMISNPVGEYMEAHPELVHDIMHEVLGLEYHKAHVDSGS